MGKGHRVVHLGKSLEQTRENNIAKSREIRLVLGREASDKRSKDLGSGGGLKVNFKNIIDLSDIDGHTFEVLGSSILNKSFASGRLGEIEKGNKPLLDLHFTKRHGKGREQDTARCLVIDNTSSLSVLEVSSPSSSMEDSSLLTALGLEDLSQLLIVVGHHGRLGTLPTRNQTVDVLNGTESFLPKLELNSSFKLKETGVKETAESLGVGKVNSMLLMAVLGSVGKILSQSLFTQTAEVGLALVNLAEIESTVGDRLVDNLEPVIAFGNIETNVVSIPTELLRRGNQSSLNPFPVTSTVNKAVKHKRSRLKGQVVVHNGNIGQSSNLLLRLLDSSSKTSFGLGNKVVQYPLDGTDIGGLGSRLENEEAGFGVSLAVENDTEINELGNDGLKDVDGSLLESFPK